MSASVTISSVVLSRYAKAIFELAAQDGATSKVEKDFKEIADLIEKSDDFANFLMSQSIGAGQQRRAIVQICDQAKAHKLTANFLNVLVENRRLSALLGIIKAFSKILSERSGNISVSVETAEKLTAAQQKELKSKIEKALDRRVTLEPKISPEIIGGMIVTIGSYMIDDSVRRKIERLGVALRSNDNQNTIQNLQEVV